jgi:hypothetical protein
MKNLTNAQQLLVSELVNAYGINPDDVIFYDENNEGVLTYDASCIMLNELVNPQNIQDFPYYCENPDSVGFEVIITLFDGRQRGSVGIVNLGETIDGKEMSDLQRKGLGLARGMRAALRKFGIDLIKLHKTNGKILDLHIKSNKASLIGEAHRLGEELCWIIGKQKDAWYLQLKKRYGVNNSNQLDETQLADFNAFMRGLLKPKQLAA